MYYCKTKYFCTMNCSVIKCKFRQNKFSEPASQLMFLLKNGDSFKIIDCERIFFTENRIASWMETTLQTILSNYNLDNIFLLTSFACFPTVSQIRLLHFLWEKCMGGKSSKVILTGMTAAECNWRDVAQVYNKKTKSNYTLSITLSV